MSSYLQLDSLQPAETEGAFSTVAFASENVGGLASSQVSAQREYVVAEGDTLSTIAAKYDLHSGSIVLSNKDLDNTEVIHPGQILIIPEVDAPEEQLKSEWDKRQDKQTKAVATKAKDKQKTLASAVAAAPSSKLRLGTPVSYSYKSQNFSAAHPGTDFVANIGTPIRASADGCIILVSSGWNGGYGNTLILNIGDGYSLRYAHLNGFSKYDAGDCVDRGTVLGYSGNSGRSTGPHLHFEVRRNGTALNPAAFGL